MKNEMCKKSSSRDSGTECIQEATTKIDAVKPVVRKAKTCKATKPKPTPKKTILASVVAGEVAVTDNQEVPKLSVEQIPKRQKGFEDYVACKCFARNGSLVSAITACSVPWNDRSKQLIDSQFKWEHEAGDGINPMPIFIVAYHRRKFYYALCFSDLIIKCSSVIISKIIDFRSAAVYKREKSSCECDVDYVCKYCSGTEYTWDKFGENRNLKLLLDERATEYIKAACQHWHEQYVINNVSDEITFRSKNHDFKMLGCNPDMLGKNWSGDAVSAVNLLHSLMISGKFFTCFSFRPR